MIEVLKQMVEALEVDAYVYNGEKSWAAIQAGKQAIAELESQEPVCPECKAEVLYECVACSRNNYPPQRTWVGLTDEEIDSYFEDHGWSPSEYYYPVIKDIEDKLKELNL